MLRRVILLPLLVASVAAPSAAQVPLWTVDGVAVCGVPCLSDRPHITPDGEGGVYIAWEDSRDFLATSEDIYLQHLAASGEAAEGWPASGIPVCRAAASQILTGLANDGFGGALLVWQDYREPLSGYSSDVYCQRILSNGSIAPGWTPDGNAACRWPEYQGPASIISDGDGGAYVLWDDQRATGQVEDRDVYAQHFDVGGQIAAGWMEGGLSVTAASGYQSISNGPHHLLPDGTGGMIAAWSDCVAGLCDSYGLRIHENGSVAQGWPTSGQKFFQGLRIPRIASDGAGGFYVASGIAGELGSDQDLFVLRFALDGTRLPSWPEQGLPICCPGEAFGGPPKVTPDGEGGLLLARSDDVGFGSDIYVFRVQSDASLAPGWSFGGNPVSDPSASNYDEDLVADDDGGVFLSWEAQQDQTIARLQHLASSGLPAEGWPDFGIRVTSFRSQFDTRITSDSAGGAIVVWNERGGTGSRRGLFAQRFVDDGATQTRPSLVSAEAEEGLVTLVWYAKEAGGLGATVERRTQVSDWSLLGEASADGPDGLRFEDRAVLAGERYAYRLGYRDGDMILYTDETWVDVPLGLRLALDGFRPNPAVGPPIVALSLPDAKSAVLEVLDVSGRRLVSREVGSLGPGRHEINLSEAGRWPPGVYWIRLRSGNETIDRRGIVLGQ